MNYENYAGFSPGFGVGKGELGHKKAKEMKEMQGLAAIVEKMKGTRVLCLGDVMLDRYVSGGVSRISQEAPIPVLRIEREKFMLGSAGNVAANMSGLGVAPILVAVAGQDDTAQTLAALLRSEAGGDSGLVRDASRPTTVKTRFLAAGQQLLRADFESTAEISPAVEDQVIEKVAVAVKNCDVVVISDYAKGLVTKRVAQETIRLARAAGKPVIVDPTPQSDCEFYRGASFVTPNRKELGHAAGMEVKDDESVVKACRIVMEKFGISAVIATRSEDGMTIVTADAQPVHLPTQAREVYDVTGAGDTVVAAMAGALAAGATPVEAAQIGNIAAGIVVEKVGTAIVRSDEVLEALNSSEVQDRVDHGLGHAMIVTCAQAVEQVERWRRKGLKVGFTNGCFDLVHPGHISLLRQARAQCDKLIVGLNSDSSVKKLKGPTRPVQDQNARSTVLGSLAAVDMIVIFEEETPIDLIKTISPDVLVKGADYTVSTVVGADHVIASGGRVFLANLEDGHSTTKTIARMAG